MARDVECIPSRAFERAAAWRSADLTESDWVWPVPPALVSELESGAREALAAGKRVEALTVDDFPGASLRAESDRWLEELDRGLGFLLLRGLPVASWGREVSEFAYVGLGLSLGALASQNAAGDVLGHIRDTGADPSDPSVRLYKTREAQPFHTDGADVIGLLCLQPSARGGVSRIVSSLSVAETIQRRRPDLAPLLFEPFHFDRNEEQGPGEAPTFQLPLAHWDGDRLRIFYVGWYIRDAERHASVPRLTRSQHELLDAIDATALELHLEMNFQPGDVQLLKNASVLHGRTAYEDDPARPRHLLRVWVNARGDFRGADDFVNQGIPKRAGVASDREGL